MTIVTPFLTCPYVPYVPLSLEIFTYALDRVRLTCNLSQEDMSCLFCEILAGKIPASFVYRDNRVAAFMDIQPVNAGHVLVVPIAHAVGLEDLKSKDGEAVFLAAQRVARALSKSGLRCEGVNLFLADGQAALQEVFHLHLHVIPRFAGDGFGLKFPETYSQKPPRDGLETAALAISEVLK